MKSTLPTNKKELINQYCAKPTRALRDKIVLSYIHLVEYVAKKFSYRREEIEDLVQVGTIGLIKALENFNTDKDVEFTTYATTKIIGEIKHYFRDKSKLIKVPRKLQELSSKIKAYIKNHAYEKGIAPTVKETAIALECTEEEILEAMEVSQVSTALSLDSPSHSSDGKDRSNSLSLLDSLGISGRDESIIDHESLRQALGAINAREQRIIYLRYYDNLTQMEIAERLQLSQMHISRLLNHALVKIKRAMKR